MTSCERLRLLLSTARHIPPSQIYHRAARTLRRRWWKLHGRTAPKESAPATVEADPVYAGVDELNSPGPWQEDITQAVARGREIVRGQFSFLNQRVDCSPEIPWHGKELSQLWRYHLHYFDYVEELLVLSRTSKDGDAYRCFKRLAESWIASNAKIEGDGWHPYTISLRLVNWLHAVVGFAVDLAADIRFKEDLLRSTYGQAIFLAENLELDVRGNHLLKNLRALIFAGSVFESPAANQWRKAAVDRLRAEIMEQVLPDGGHFERSPGYHVAVLADCIEMALTLARTSAEPCGWLDDAIRRMLDYLNAIVAPDGQTPLLKDTAWDAALFPATILTAGGLYLRESKSGNRQFGLFHRLRFGEAGWQQFCNWPAPTERVESRHFPETGHFVLRDNKHDDFLIFDAGKPCPDYLPAHAHADLLTYELSIGGRRVVVDSGVYEYQRGPWRDHFRSTRAHNTVEVEETNQSEVWDSFRVARRARPTRAIWRETDDYIVVQGEHDGYDRLAVPVRHRRTLVWKKAEFWLVVDQLLGEGETDAASHLHLHPDLELARHTPDTWAINGRADLISVAAFGFAEAGITKGKSTPPLQGWYSERFGEKRPNDVLTFQAKGALPICCGYALTRGQPARLDCFREERATRIAIACPDQTHTLELTDSDFSFK